jgi:electron transfer flavoprotein alpha subunit
MANDIFVFVEYKDGSVRKVSLELLTKGKEIAAKNGATLYAGIIGWQVKDIVDTVMGFADKVIVVDNETLKDYRYDAYVSVLEQLIKKYQPSMVFGGSTVTGKDMFPRLAARLNVPIISDAVGVAFDGDRLKIKKPLYGGKVISWLSIKEGVYPLVTFRPNSFSVEKLPSNGEVIEEKIDVSKDPKIVVLKADKGSTKKVDLQEADFIICGGRGMKGPENFQALEEIADIMGGRVGASRAVVDSKWREYDDQVGKSGKSVSPKL